MFATILVPVDGSPLAERALPYAARLAHSGAGRLLLARAATQHDLTDAFPTLSQAAAQVENEVEALAARARDQGVAVETRVYVEPTDPARAILEASRQEQADLIAMSTHGRAGIGRWIYGSVADQVLRQAVVPVLLVTATCERTWDSEPKGAIVVPLDGSELAEAALAPAESLAEALGASLLLVQVVEFPSYAYGYLPAYPVYIPFDDEAELARAQAYLEKVAAGPRTRGHQVGVFATVGLPAVIITQLAREGNAMAIAMTSHGRGGLARLVMGSVATQVLQMTPVPVLQTVPRAVSAAEERGSDAESGSGQ